MATTVYPGSLRPVNFCVRSQWKPAVYHSLKTVIGACALLVAASTVWASSPQQASPITAIRIVLDTQQAKIRAVDNPGSWWHDTKERAWSVKRPVEPGVVDTTHLFIVTYEIDGAVVASWQVNTLKGTAVAVP